MRTLAAAMVGLSLLGVLVAMGVAQAGDTDSGSSLNNSISTGVNGGTLTIQSADLTDNGGTSQVHQRLDVRSGGSNPTYKFKLRVNDTNGWTDVTQVDVYAWYDNGNNFTVWANSTASANYRFHFQYTKGAGSTTGSIAKVEPSGNEITAPTLGESSVDNETQDLTVSFTFGNQVHYSANAQGADSWSFDVTAAASGGLTNDFAATHGDQEFGVYRFVSITVTGSPSGSASPGSTANLTTPHTVTFSSNGPFYLEAQASALRSGGNSIPITDIKINSADASTAAGSPDLGTTPVFFGSPDNTIDIYGAYNNGTSPSAHGAYASGTSYVDRIYIQVTIQLGQATGTYTGLISYRIWQTSASRP